MSENVQTKHCWLNSLIPGQDKNLNVNVISDTNVINEPSTVIAVELPDIIPLQRNCVDTKPFFDYFEKGLLPANEKEAHKLVIESRNIYEIIDGRLYHIHHPCDKGINQLKPIIKTIVCTSRSYVMTLFARIMTRINI